MNTLMLTILIMAVAFAIGSASVITIIISRMMAMESHAKHLMETLRDAHSLVKRQRAGWQSIANHKPLNLLDSLILINELRLYDEILNSKIKSISGDQQ